MDHVALGPARQVVADTPKPKRLNPFERYLSLWVALCMAAGVLLGLAVPGLTDGLRRLEFGAGSQINIPIAILIWLMITPMMMKVDFGSIRNVGRRPKGLFVTLFVNWLVKVLLYSVMVFIVVPLIAGVSLRQWFMRTRGRVWFEHVVFLVNEIRHIERPVSVARAASPRRSTGSGWERSAA